MTLIDGDKTTDRRSEPELGAHDVMDSGSVKAHATDGIAYRSVDGLRKARVISRDDQIIVHDGSYNKALFGRDGSGNYVVKVAKNGFDVLTASDGDLIFNSANNLFKIVYTSPTVSIPSSGTATSTVTVAHGLSYTPTILAFASVASVYQPTPAIDVNTTTGAVLSKVEAYVDATNVTIKATYPGSTVPSGNSVKYYLMRETAN